VSQFICLTFFDAFCEAVALTGAPPLISISQSRTASACCASWREANQVGRVALLSELRGNIVALEPSGMWAVSKKVDASATTAKGEDTVREHD
jgi:hypothetical protein